MKAMIKRRVARLEQLAPPLRPRPLLNYSAMPLDEREHLRTVLDTWLEQGIETLPDDELDWLETVMERYPPAADG